MTPAPREATVVAHSVGPVGGMEQMLSALVAGLLERGFAVTVVASRCHLAPNERLRWVRVPGPSRPFALAYLWFFVVGSLVTWRRRRGVVNTTGAIVFNRADVATVHYCHHGSRAKTDVVRASRPGTLYRWNARLSAWLARVGERWCYRPERTARLVAVSRGVADELVEWIPAAAGRVDVIPNGVDRDAYAPDPESGARTRSALGIGAGDPVALFVGGDWERKGVAFAIDAVAAAPGWHLIVVGPGDVERYRRVAEEAAPGRVHFVGPQDETQPYYAAADAFVFPTAYEAFPVALLEAAASGLALLVTPVSGARDLVVEGESGWFVDRDGDAIGARLRALGQDRDAMRRMGAAARESTVPMTWDAVADAYAALYEDLGNAPARVRPAAAT